MVLVEDPLVSDVPRETAALPMGTAVPLLSTVVKVASMISVLVEDRAESEGTRSEISPYPYGFQQVW